MPKPRPIDANAAPTVRRGRVRAIVVLVAAVLAAAGTASLGAWQLGRASQKQAMQEALDARRGLPELTAGALASTPADALVQHYRRIQLRGEWMRQGTVFLDNRQMDGRPGFLVVTPLKLPGGDAVLVQRGWVPRDFQDRTRLPAVASPEGIVDVEGQVAPPPPRLYEFAGGDADGASIRQNLDLARYSAELGVALRPVSVMQADAPALAGDGLKRHWPMPTVDIHKHHGYAFQWFALCALITGLYVWFQIIRPRLPRRAE